MAQSIETRDQPRTPPDRSWARLISHELGGPIAVLSGYASMWAEFDLGDGGLIPDGRAMLADSQSLVTGLREVLQVARLVDDPSDPVLAAALQAFQSRGRPATLRLRSLLEAQLEAGPRGAARTAVQACHVSTGLLLGLLDQLALSVAVGNGTAQDWAVVDLDNWIRHLIHDVAAAAAARGHRLLAQGGRQACRVRITPDLLQAAVLNMVDNAQKHSPPGMPILLSVDQTSTHALLRVGDRGPGLPEELVPAAFLRVEQSLSFALPGLGLGLMIASKVAELNGGSLLYALRVGGGAEFSIELPRLP